MTFTVLKPNFGLFENKSNFQFYSRYKLPDTSANDVIERDATPGYQKLFTFLQSGKAPFAIVSCLRQKARNAIQSP